MAGVAARLFCQFLLAFLEVAVVRADKPDADRILFIYQDSSTLPSAMGISEGLEDGLQKLTKTDVEIYTEFLDSGRFASPAYFGQIAALLTAKYERVALDVVVPLGPEAVRFLLQNRSRIAKSASVIFGDISDRTLGNLAPPADVGGVITAYDIGRTIDLAKGLQRDATEIVVVSGSAEFDQYWLERAKQTLGSKYSGLPVQYISGLTLDAFSARVRELSSQAILLILTINEDADRRKYRPRDAMAVIAASSGAPSYGVIGSFIGGGVVGGYAATYRTIGADVASAVMRLLSTDEARPRIDRTSNRTVVDWRQLQRWRLDPNRLPKDVELLNYSPSVWEQYRWEIGMAGTALLAQALAIAGLLYERRGRRAAEQAAGKRLLEVVHLNQSATAGALSASIAHELNQPLGAIRNNTRAAELVLKSPTPDLALMEQILADIRDDDQRASDIITGLRGMLKKRGEIEWQELDLNEVVANAMNILHSEADRQQVEMEFRRSAARLPVRADRLHLQQVILNIVTNAMDAMTETASRKLVLKTAVVAVGQAQVSVADTGTGIPNEKLARIFETFYTTKSAGTGLGLSIARTVVESYGGRIWAENRPGGGAVVSFVLPIAGAT